MLTFRHVSFSYQSGRPLLSDVEFSLSGGSCTILAGRNGSGKSTIVQLANGLLRPSSGDILVKGEPTVGRDMHDIVRDVAVMFQHPGDQITERTVKREVMLGLSSLGLDLLERRLMAALQLVELAHRAEDHPYDLEPSERKLVTLAATIAMNTPVVVLDEPLVGLGPSEVRLVDRVVRQLRLEGRSVLFVTHDILQAWSLADRVLVLLNGAIACDAPIGQGVTPSHVFAAANMPPPTVERVSVLLESLL